MWDVIVSVTSKEEFFCRLQTVVVGKFSQQIILQVSDIDANLTSFTEHALPEGSRSRTALDS